jgi:hypothetical protein
MCCACRSGRVVPTIVGCDPRFHHLPAMLSGKLVGIVVGQDHAFASAGRTDHQNIMGAGRGESDGAFDGFLASDVGEVEVGGELAGLIGLAVELVGFEGEKFIEKGDGLSEIGNGVDIDAIDDGGFAGVFFGEDDAFEIFLFGEEGEGERAFDFSEAAIEGELAGEKIIFVVVGLDEVGAAEEADGGGRGRALPF